jgi:uridylate kinase
MPCSMKVSISLGGSLLTGKNNDNPLELNPETYKIYSDVLRKLHEEGHELMVVCGGGGPARHFIETAKMLGATRYIQDMLGVKATHVNALLVMAALGEVADQSRIYQRASDLANREPGKILVGGGYKPGSSTDYRAVIFAGKMGADLIVNASDVDGVYDCDPRKHPEAKKLKELSFKELEGIIKRNTVQSPGEYGLFDLKAVRLAAKLAIPIVFIDGRDPEEIKRSVYMKHNGSLVK